MPIDYASVLYMPGYNMFARTIVVTPLVSQPNMPAYTARGIYTTQQDDVLTEEGAIFSDQKTILDIIAKEFEVLPLQGDHVFIPTDSGVPEAGMFEIIDLDDNGGGEITLSIRKWVDAKPPE
jgi:hypothetical protein